METKLSTKKVKDMTLEELKQLDANREKIQDAYVYIGNRIDKLEETRDILEDQPDFLDSVDNWHEGIPISRNCYGMIRPAFEVDHLVNYRYAEIREVRYRKGAFVLFLHQDLPNEDHTEKWCGNKWECAEDAKDAAIQWIVHGTVPPKNGRK